MENQEFNQAILIEGNFDEQSSELVQALPKMLEGLMSSIGIKVSVGYASPTEVEVEEEAEGGCDPCEGCGECDTDAGHVAFDDPELFRALQVLSNNIIETDMIWMGNVGKLIDKYDPTNDGVGHPFFLFEGWKQKVAAGVTSLGYWDWVEERIAENMAKRFDK